MSQPTTVKPGEKVRLREHDPRSSAGLKRQDPEVAERRAEALQRTCELQERLYAEGRQALLIVLQAMDTGGKDGTIKHVMRGLNPQGCSVVSFKAPTAEELARDFLWRVHRQVPAKGMITVFNRSHYEDVLVVRVRELFPEAVWRPRFDRINEFERLLVENGTRVLKLFLHISKEEQKKRLEARLANPAKHWKFHVGDLEDRARWDDYVAAYEETLSRCSTSEAPWHIIPADRKWYRNLVVAELVAATLAEMNPQWPAPEVDLSTVVVE